MTRGAPAALAVVATSTILGGAGLAVGIAGAEGDELTRQALMLVLATPFLAVGALIVTRRPGHAVGALCLAIGALWAVVATSTTLGEIAAREGWGRGADWIGWPGWLWIVAVGLMGTHLPLRLPDGKLQAPGWRRFARVCTAAMVLGALAMATAPAQDSSLENPLEGPAGEGALVVALALLGACILGALGGLVARYRRGDGGTRLRLRWVAAGAAVVVVTDTVAITLLSTVVADDSAPGTALAGMRMLGYTAIPIAIGVAILRHRLLDIDVAINRALVYAALTAVLAAAYVGLVLLLGAALAPVTSGSDLAIALSTLAVAALFRPVRMRVQRLVDRRFYRHKYDAERTLERFAARMRTETDLEALHAELTGVVRESMQPAHVSLWLRGPG
jgi:hypothetical protein